MILIISPNLEPAHCGVSDYALELRRLYLKNKVEVKILAMADIYINEVVENEFSLRIPACLNNNKKIDQALHYIQEIKPKEIYFNLVSYGYQKKGFPFFLLKFFKLSNTKITIIAHELWMGNFSNETVKSKILGFFQKKLLVRLLISPRVKRIFVSTDISKNILKTIGISAKTIPVFSNIPIAFVNKNQIFKSDAIVFILFGSFAFHVNADAFVEFIKLEFLKKGKNVIINHVGVYRGYIEEWEKIKINLTKHKVIFHEYGIIDAIQISTLLQSADYGLTSYMPHFWSKSGAIAAMLAHGLPVFSISKGLHLNKFKNQLKLNPRIINISETSFNYCVLDFSKMPYDKSYNDIIFKLITESN